MHRRFSGAFTPPSRPLTPESALYYHDTFVDTLRQQLGDSAVDAPATIQAEAWWATNNRWWMKTVAHEAEVLWSDTMSSRGLRLCGLLQNPVPVSVLRVAGRG
jgi:hypothetical protein